MHFGLTQYIPIIMYSLCMLIAFLSLFVSPKIGVIAFFPLLPYQTIFERFKPLPMGKDMINIVFISILVGWLIRGGRTGSENNQIKAKLFERSDLNLPVILLALATLIGLINGGSNIGFDYDYVANWKNYMMLPLLWLLTFNIVKDRKTLLLLSFLLIIGILGADYYFRYNLKWMNVWHFSDKARDMMTGLFVYLGANHYGAFFAHFIFILIGFLIFVKSKMKKVLLLFVIALTGYCLVYTFSRGAYLALLISLAFIGLVKDKKILLLVILILVFWKSFAPVSVIERVEMTRTEDGELENSAATRIVLWNKALEMFQESPVIGKGYNTFLVYSGRDSHNIYMKIASELGIVGLIAFIYLFYKSFLMAWRLYSKANDRFFKGLGLGMAACIISVMITNAFGDRWSFLSLGSYYWILLGMVNRALLITETQVKEGNV